nr:hypothetical protein [Tanacetum cinerariifolium]
DFTVTYTEVSSPFEDLSDIGSPGVDGLPMMPQDPYAYVEAALQAPPSPDYVPTAVSPTVDSPGYIPESDSEEDPKEDKKDPEKDLADYPTDGEDDEEEEESSRDDADNKEEDEDEEEEEHQAPSDSVPPHVHRVTARMFVRAQTPISLPSETEVARLLAIPRYRAVMFRLRAKAPSTSHQLPSSTAPSRTSPLLPIPLPTSSPPLLLPSTSNKADVLEVTLLPQKRLCIALGSRFKVGESSSAFTARPTGGFRADYGFVGTLDDEIRRDPEREDDSLLMSGQLNMLRRDKCVPARTARLIEGEARLSREAWVLLMDASDTTRAEKMAPKNQINTSYNNDHHHYPMTNAQLKALTEQGVADALAARDANRSRNGGMIEKISNVRIRE